MESKLEIKSLSILSKATRMLAEVKTIEDAKKIMDLADAAKIFAQKAKLGEEAINHAHAIKIEAEKMVGMMLKETERAKGTRRQLIGPGIIGDTQKESPINIPTLSELGLSKKESSEAQFLEELSSKKPEVYEKIRNRKICVTKAEQKRNKKSLKPNHYW